MEQAASTAEVRYGGFWIRLVAYLIDGVILSVISLVLTRLGAVAGPEGVNVLGLVVAIVYIIGFWTWRGQTPGKMALGLKVVQTDGSPIGLGRAVLRYIGYIVSSIILGIGFLMVAWDGRKQGLHDKIAGTLVIRTK